MQPFELARNLVNLNRILITSARFLIRSYFSRHLVDPIELFSRVRESPFVSRVDHNEKYNVKCVNRAAVYAKFAGTSRTMHL